jgi:hypothetical protein
MSDYVSIGNGDSVKFNYITGNRGSGEVEAILRLKSGSEHIIKMKSTDRKKLMTITGRSIFISKRGAMRKLANGKSLSPGEARKAFEGLAEILKEGSHSQGKIRSLQTMRNESILQQCSSASSVVAPGQLNEVYSQRDREIFSIGSARHYKTIMTTILQKALNGHEPAIATEKISEEIVKLQRTINGFNGFLNSYTDGEISKEDFLNNIRAMKRAVIRQLDQLFGNGEGTKLFRQHYPLALSENNRAWTTFNGTSELVSSNGGIVAVTSTLKPANQMGCFSYLGNGPGQRRGISSMERDTPHAVNLWETEFRIPGLSRPLFKGIRCGCTRGQEGTSKEIIVACLAQKIGMENLTDGRGTRENPIPFQLANVQLMTPGGKLGISTDQSLPQKQMDAFKALAKQQQPIELNIPAPDGTNKVYVNFQPPLLFNFGSNLQQFDPKARALLAKDVSRKNAKSIKKLLGNSATIAKNSFNPHDIDLEREKGAFTENSLVGKFLKSDASERDKKIVIQLAHQIADIWQSQRCAIDGSEPYAIQSRLALLTYKLGLSTTFNCKSGKDRTGVANAEINNLAIEIEINGGIVPKPYHSLDDRERLNLGRMVTDSGANHVTRACTGLQGLKIVNSFGSFRFSGVEDRMGDVKGASSEAKSN